MLVPLSWLRDFAPFDLDPRELGRVFDDLGMVVEGITMVGEGLGGVVVARVEEIHQIPKADKIRQVVVDAGGERVEVVCGAWNFAEGDLVPLATVGSVLPGDFEIVQRKMRGVVSNGMLCSAVELRLGADAAGIMVLPSNLEPGAPFAEAMGIDADVVYDLAIEGNRPDALSMVGVARDAAARLRLPFSTPEPAVDESGTAATDLATIEVDATDLCPRFTGRVVTGVTVGPSPAWVARRLTLAGMRPINNVVDASNYVMLELGQPNHPYDLAKLPGSGLRVRRAGDGETIVTLDDVERRLSADDCLICDGDDQPVGVAGVMGGAAAEISDATTDILLETAYFDPMAIAWTSKRLKLRTEASLRFEKGTDPGGIERAAARFMELVGSGTVAPGVLDRDHTTPPGAIRVRVDRVNEMLGTDLDGEKISEYLRPIGFETSTDQGAALNVVPPSFRPDVEVEINVIEEVARHHGYSNIARRVPLSPHVGDLTPHQRERRRLRELLVGAGINEAMTPSLVGPGDHFRSGLVEEGLIHAADPMIIEESILRTSLLPGLLRSLAFNAARRSPDVAFFEIGKVFRRPAAGEHRPEGVDAALPDEREQMAVAIGGADGAPAAKRLLDTLVEGLRLANVRLVPAEEVPGLHPTRTVAVLDADGAMVGHAGEVDPDVSAAWDVPGRVGWIDLELPALFAARRRPTEEQPVSKFPSSDIDLAFVVDESTAAGDVEATLADAAGDLLVGLELFDVFRSESLGAAKRSLAWRLRFCALDHTLTDAEVAEVRQRCIDAVQAAHPAELRG